jgi:hypothetical protein
MRIKVGGQYWCKEGIVSIERFNNYSTGASAYYGQVLLKTGETFIFYWNKNGIVNIAHTNPEFNLGPLTQLHRIFYEI